MLELQRQHNRYVSVSMPLTVSEAEPVESEGGYGEDPVMRSPQGIQTAGAVTELLKPFSCQHETAQHQLSPSQIFREKHPAQQQILVCLPDFQP